jgi:transcriptional regulator with XRE-family HTH domain
LPGTGSPTVRRRELGILLKSFRTARGWTVDQVAERLMVSSSKVSRLETGQRGASPRDIRDICRLYGVSEEQRQRLTDLAAEGKQHAWWQTFDLPYTTYIGLEAEATSIKDFGLGVIPGLLQVPGYARVVTQAAVSVPRRTPDTVERIVGSRIARQQRILEAETSPSFTAIIDVSVLHRVVGSRMIMRAQLHHLLELSQLPNVTLRVIPNEAGALPVATTKFIILSFADHTLPDIVYIEGLTGELFLERKDDTDIYSAAFQELEDLAASPEASRRVITSSLLSYQKLWQPARITSGNVRPHLDHRECTTYPNVSERPAYEPARGEFTRIPVAQV